MNKRNKKKIGTIIDIYGYATGMAIAVVMLTFFGFVDFNPWR